MLAVGMKVTTFSRSSIGQACSSREATSAKEEQRNIKIFEFILCLI